MKNQQINAPHNVYANNTVYGQGYQDVREEDSYINKQRGVDTGAGWAYNDEYNNSSGQNPGIH